MLKWYTPPEMPRGTAYQDVRFNDECGYYIRGWKWIQENYSKKAAYRHRYNPFHDESGPVPGWSPTALRGRIMADDETAEQFLSRGGTAEDEDSPVHKA